jgi:hypothetical protein
MKLPTDEIRGAFKTEKGVNFESVANLRYLNAFLKETQRIYSADTYPPRELLSYLSVQGNLLASKIRSDSYVMLQ